MPPEEDSQRRENDGQDEKSGSGSQPKDRPVGFLKTHPRSHSSASEMGKRVSTIGSLGMIPILLAVGPIIGIFIGKWLDNKFDSSPWLTILFVILGFVAGIRETILLLKRENAKEDKDKKSNDTDN